MAANNGKRMVKEDLLNYLEAVQTNYPDPSDIGGGSSYTAGTGIKITDNTISVNSTVVALKSDLLDYVTTSKLTTELSNYVTSTDLATELLDYAELSDLATVATTGSYNDLSNKPDLSVYAKLNDDTQNITASTITVTPGAGYIHTTYGPTTIAMSIPRTPGYTITIPTKDGTIALTSDIPSLTGYATESWVTNQGYSTFSGSYNDLTNKPTIPDAVSGTNDGTNWTSLTIGNTTYNIPSGGGSYSAGTGIDITNNTIAIDSTVVALKSDIPSLTGYATKAWVNSQGYSTFSGSYNDLTYKPTIPTISGEYDSYYWTSLTINGRNRSIPSTSGCVTVNTSQNINGVKTFLGQQKLKFKRSSSSDILGFTAYDRNGDELGNLQIANRTVDGNDYVYTTLGNYSNNASKSKLGFRVQPNGSSDSFNFVMPYGTTTEFTSNTYSRLSDTTIPCAFTDGTTIVKADATGLVNISSISGGGSGSSQLYVMVEVNGYVQNQDNNYTYLFFSLIVDISNMTINDAKELYNNNNANYDFAASAATYPSNFNYGQINFSDGTGEHHINSITYDSVNEIVTLNYINYNDGLPHTFTFSESNLTRSSIISIANS